MEKKIKKTLDIKSLLFGKIPPHSKDIERSILGIMLTDSNTVSVVEQIITPDDFYALPNQIICKAIFEVAKKFTPDFVLVAQWVIDNGFTEEIGGIYEISKLTDRVTSCVNIKQYAIIVKQKSVQRRLVEFGAHILTLAGNEQEDVFEVILEAENKLKGINSELHGMETTPLLQIAMEVVQKFDDKVYKAKNDIVDENAIYTGFPEWDELNGPMFPGLYVIAGRPGMGKGVHMTELICRMGKKYPVGVINGEMTDDQLMKRIGCNLKGIDNFLFKKNPKYVTDEEQLLLKEAMEEAINLKFHIENSKNIHKIANKIKLWVDSYGVKCVFADFLTMFKVPPELERYYTKTQQIDYILEIFVDLCKTLNIPIILYAQMNREILGRAGVKEPNLGDLKQSGSIEELAYQVSLLHRPEYYDEKSDVDENGESIKGLMYQIIAKHRDGKLGRLKFNANLAMSQIKTWETSLFNKIDKNFTF